MRKKFRDWDESLAEELQDLEFAKFFIMASLDDGFELFFILNKVIRSYGLKEFSKIIEMTEDDLIQILELKKTENFDQILKPFNLSINTLEEKWIKTTKE